jgi:lipid-A-disaccharide synthase
MRRSTTCAFVAGEASGDLIAAGVVAELRQRAPELRCAGIGGDRMIESGFEAWGHVRELSVRGYVEVLRHLPRLLRLRANLLTRLRAEPPAVFVGVDAPDFNLGLEEKLRASGVPVVHYVSPSIWAWRSERLGQIRHAVDRMLLVFPFEQQIYDDAGIPATYVGHPLASMIPLLPDAVAARARLGLGVEGPLVAVLPGSRADEVRHLGPPFIAAMSLLRAREAGLRFVIPAADPALKHALATMLASHAELSGCVTLTDGRSHDCLEAADVVLVASGTATLEAALYKRPMVIAYRMPALSAWIMRRKGTIAFVGLPNILAGESLVPELLQEQVTPAAIADTVHALLRDDARRAALAERFSAMHRELRRDTAALAADSILEVARR